MFEESVSSSPTFWAGLYSWFTPTVFFVLLQLVIGTIYITSTLTNATHKHQHQPHEQDPPQGANFPHPHHQQELYRSPSVLQRLKSINLYSYPYRSQENNTTPHQLQTHEHENPQLARSPSSVLQRLKSINLYSYFPTEPFSSKLMTTTDTNTDTNTNTNVFSTPEPEKRHVAVTEEEEEELEVEEDDDDVLGQIKDNLGGGGGEGEGNSSMEDIYRKLQGQGQGGNFERSQSDTKPAAGEVPEKLARKMKKSASSKSAFSHFKEEDIVESRRPATVRESKVAAVDDDVEVDAKADDFINKFKQQLKLQRLDSIMRYKEVIHKGTEK